MRSQGYMFTARWLYRHGFAYSPYNPRYSLMPIHTELVYSLTFAFGTDLAAKVMDGFLGVLFLFGIYEFARRYASPLFSFLAAASMASMTAFVANWGNGKVDITSAFVLFSAFALLFSKSELGASRNLLWSSFLAGTACAQKYTNWIFVPSFFLALILILRARGQRRTLGRLAAAGVVIVLCLVPHFVRDVVLANNPVAPFAKGLFPTRNVYLGHASDALRAGISELPKLPYVLFLPDTNRASPGRSASPSGGRARLRVARAKGARGLADPRGRHAPARPLGRGPPR